MKDLFQKYPMKEGETMGSWQHRVTQQIYKEKYANKTLKEMKEIREQYKKEHPREFDSKYTQFVSPEYSAIYLGLDEASKENKTLNEASKENKTTITEILRGMITKNKGLRNPKEILDDPRINAYRRQIHINIIVPSYKFILSARQEGNEEFLRDVGKAISKNLGSRDPGRFYVRDGFYSVEVYDTPEVRKALEAVFEKHGVDTALLKQEKSKSGMRKFGIKKQPNPSVAKMPECKPTTAFTEDIKKMNLADTTVRKCTLSMEQLMKNIKGKEKR